jgi:hypothetical protein
VKTSGGTRVLYFFDEGCVVVCSEALPKPKQRGRAGDRARRPADRGGPVTELPFKQMFAEA